MPIYEYYCVDCGEKHEHLQSVNDTPFEQCPDCGGAHYKKLLSVTGFQLKGSGWYATDFKNKGTSTPPTSTETPPCQSGNSCPCVPSSE